MPRSEQDVIAEINAAKGAVSAQKQKPQGFGLNTAQAVRIQDSIKPTAANTQSADKAEPEVEPAPAAPETQAAPEPEKPAATFSEEQVKQLFSTLVEPLKTELNTLKEEVAAKDEALNAATAKLSETERKAAEVQSQNDAIAKLADALSLNGLKGKGGDDTSKGSPALVTSMNDSPKGLAVQLVDVMEKANTLHDVYDRSTNSKATQRDGKPISSFIQECFSEARAQGKSWRESGLVKDVEEWAKGLGYLQGRETNATTGPTTGASGRAPDLFLDVLSAMLRETHNTSNVFWQFATTVYDPTSAPSKNVLVPRLTYLDEPTDTADFLLADYDTYNSVAYAVGTSSDSQAQVITTVPVGINQYGIGRSSTTANRPVFIPEFHQATALMDLMMAVDVQLMQHYYKFEDLLIRLIYESSTIVRYNDGGTSTDTPGNVGTGDDGTMTADFLDAVYAEMFENAVPSLPNGSYILVLNAEATRQFKQSLTPEYEAPSDAALMELSNILTGATGVNIARASGYLGNYHGFEVFTSNSFGKGTAGSSPTVQTTAFGTGNVTTADSFAFGPGAVGRGIALPMEVRSQLAPFGDGTAYVWRSREGCAALDVDSALTASQQDRVYKLRCKQGAPV